MARSCGAHGHCTTSSSTGAPASRWARGGAVAGVEPAYRGHDFLARRRRGDGVAALRLTPSRRMASCRVLSLRPRRWRDGSSPTPTRRALALGAAGRRRATSKAPNKHCAIPRFHARASSADGCRNIMGFGHSHTSMIRKNFSNTTAGSFRGYFWQTKATRMAQLMPPSNPRTLL